MKTFEQELQDAIDSLNRAQKLVEDKAKLSPKEEDKLVQVNYMIHQLCRFMYESKKDK